MHLSGSGWEAQEPTKHPYFTVSFLIEQLIFFSGHTGWRYILMSLQ